MSNTVNGTVEIKNLRLWACHGVLEHEKVHPQEFLISVKAKLNLDDAVQSDNVAATLDYSAVCTKVASIAQNNCFDLIEKLAFEIATAIFSDLRMMEIFVQVKKVRPPMPFDVDYAGVELTLDRDK